MLYFVIITITTVGFGDITPATTQGRLFCLAMVATTFVLLPLQTSKLIEPISARDPLAARFAPSRHRPHVIVFGSPSAATLQHFAAQLPQQLLVLSPDEPSEQARALIDFAKWFKWARPLRDHDLEIDREVEVFFWIDYSCVDQPPETDPGPGMAALPAYVACWCARSAPHTPSPCRRDTPSRVLESSRAATIFASSAWSCCCECGASSPHCVKCFTGWPSTVASMPPCGWGAAS